jgi:hypothetical protein
MYPKVSGLRVDNEIYAYKNKHSLRSNTKGYGVKTHYTDSQNSDTTAPSGRELYHSVFAPGGQSGNFLEEPNKTTKEPPIISHWVENRTQYLPHTKQEW